MSWISEALGGSSTQPQGGNSSLASGILVGRGCVSLAVTSCSASVEMSHREQPETQAGAQGAMWLPAGPQPADLTWGAGHTAQLLLLQPCTDGRGASGRGWAAPTRSPLETGFIDSHLLYAGQDTQEASGRHVTDPGFACNSCVALGKMLCLSGFPVLIFKVRGLGSTMQDSL